MEKETMKLHHTKYKQNYKNYILDCIKLDNNENILKTEQDKINYIFDRFYSEYKWNVDRMGKYKAMSEWLSGLALDIPFYYEDIIKLAVDMGSLDANASDSLKSKVQENYFDFMANVILSFEPKENRKAA
jgi:superoxide dismutase